MTIAALVAPAVLVACSSGQGSGSTAADPGPTSTLPAPAGISATPTATLPPPTETVPPPSPTPDPYWGLTIESLAQDSYGQGELRHEGLMAAASGFTRHLISYPSDGLTVYGFANVPPGDGPAPIVLVLHGYVVPETYSTLTYTTRYADALARLGYIVVHPNYRNHPPSESGANSFRVGYARDVLHLLALLREEAGNPGVFERADGTRIGLMGHSMGGGVTLRVIALDPQVRGAALYGSMSGDERKNFERILFWSEGAEGQEELDTPEEDLRRISPVYHLDRIEARVSIHHGSLDDVVPPEWSTELCDLLIGVGKEPACYDYPGQGHIFNGQADQVFIQRLDEFFREVLDAAASS